MQNLLRIGVAPVRSVLALGFLAAFSASAIAWAQAADPAQALFAQAQQASAKGDVKGAAQKYQEFLQKFSAHPQAGAARYGLGLALFQSPDRDFSKIAPLLDPAADDANFAERPAALYWSGACYREWARRGTPAEAAPRLERATKRFADSARIYSALSKDWTDQGNNELSPALEGSIRSRCDEIEALLAAGKVPDAVAASTALSQERGFARSRSRETGWYLIGCASYSADDLISAGRALVRLAPFEQPFLGLHARYLLGRIHQVGGESVEALEHYEAVTAGFVLEIMAARKALQANAPNVRDFPLERARLEILANGAPPDFVGDALWHAGELFYARKMFAEALERFGKLTQQFPKHARGDDARLFVGITLVQLARYPEGSKALQPLLDHSRFGAQARAWLARALLRGADPANAQAYKAALAQAVENLKQAAAKMSDHPEAASELLFELGDALQRANQPSDAAAIFKKLSGGPRTEEASARLVACLQLAGQAKPAEEAFQRFEKEHPHSPFMAAALFSYAECAFAQARAAGDSAHRDYYEESVRRYHRLIAKYPDLPQANLCRYRLAMAHHALGQYVESADALASIPEAERGGPLAGASHILADSLLRAGPPVDEARDALSASTRMEQLQMAIKALQAFVAAQPQSPEAPESMLKLGFCLQQVAMLEADPAARAAAANSAREVYEQMRAQFPNHALRAVAEYERANSLALAGDIPTALTKLPRFHQDPFAKTAIAPVALLREAQLLRALNRAPEAVTVLALCRQQHEEALKKDPARASMAALIRYHHGLALKEAKQPAEAIKVLQSVLQDYPQSEWVKACKELLEVTKP